MALRVALIASAAIFVASPAQAAERWTSPTASAGAGSCLSTSPCTLDEAIGGADATSEVVIGTGTYAITSPISIALAISVHGEPGKPAPTLQGAANLNGAVVSASAGASLSHLRITGAKAGQYGLSLTEGATGDRLVVSATAGDGAKLESSPAGTVLTNSLVTAASTDEPDAVAVKDRNGTEIGTVALRNVTTFAPSGTAISCKNTVATAQIVNTLARGGEYDVEVEGTKCTAATSNLRASGLASAVGLVTGESDLDANYRPSAASVATIDRGADDAANGTLDLAGNPRISGVRTDIGAYEHGSPVPPVAGPAPDTRASSTPPAQAPAPATVPSAAPAAEPAAAPPVAALPPAAPPQLGETVVLDRSGSGTVLVKLPGTDRYVPLTDAASLPVGTTVDTRKGSVTLSSALAGGRTQTGTFGGGLFQVRQDARARGLTDIVLTGGRFAGCPTARRAARAAAARRSKRRSRTAVVRRLWAKDKGGRFRTNGKNSVATVRGTRWLTEDRCDGTLTKVTEGAVDVRDKRTGTVRRVRAGRSLLVRRR